MIKLTYILKSDIRFNRNAHQNIHHWQNYYTETSINMDLKKNIIF